MEILVFFGAIFVILLMFPEKPRAWKCQCPACRKG